MRTSSLPAITVVDFQRYAPAATLPNVSTASQSWQFARALSSAQLPPMSESQTAMSAPDFSLSPAEALDPLHHTADLETTTHDEQASTESYNPPTLVNFIHLRA